MIDFNFLNLIGQPATAIDSSLKILGINDYAKKMFLDIARIKIQENDNLTNKLQNSSFQEIYKIFLQLIEKMNKEQIESINHQVFLTAELSIQLNIKINTVENSTFYLVTASNISQQVNRSTKLKIRYEEQLEVFRNLFDLAPIGLAIKDLEGGFFKVNKGLSEITGYTKEEIVNVPLNKIFPNSTIQREMNLISELISQKEDNFKTEREILKMNGDKIIVVESLHLIRDELDQPYLCIVSYQDITEERNLQKKLIESRQMEELGKLSGGIAHDFNNMLLPVTLCSDLALQEIEKINLPLSNDILKFQNYFRKISTSALRAKILIQKLFQYSKTGIYELTPLKLQDEILKIYNRLKYEAPSHIKLNLEIIDKDLPILGEALGLEQVVDNLVINAFHALKYLQSGIVTIRIFEDFNDAILEIEDNGSGILEEELQRIFTPFYSGQRSSKGQGMGLIVVQTIVYKMNGKLKFYSNPGKGTIFQISFPKLIN
ncbi:MAG: PAS domain S-box protein [Leptospira sp.]|nr:PAS domain S-box protein [Leptospira sp.]NCS93914.1 PAS domain S-box protein [Leptospira sp.]